MQEKIIYKEFKRKRLDHYLPLIYENYSRSYFQKLNNRQKIFVNSKVILSSYKLKYGDTITIDFKNDDNVSKTIPEKMRLDIIYEDNDIIIINKQPYTVICPCYGHLSGTLLNALIWHANNEYTPYLVHRLDKNTSGTIIFAKNTKSRINISKQFQNRSVEKIYYTAVSGTVIEDKGIIEAPLGRSPQNRKIISVNSSAKKMAITEFQTIKRKHDYTLLKVKIITGRTHQIRSHMKYINHPIIGDQQYGGPNMIEKKQYKRQVLHSYSITFMHPSTLKTMKFTAKLPNDIKELFNETKIND
ncbi:MAG: RluA family pseudouridine synthase [Endomicrobium sp.]|jgi:23S rRNA pseudouridine1911/1915/1917 synthase|nr:RluA family pseudouridine synthase [Endomicrobium sp.]